MKFAGSFPLTSALSRRKREKRSQCLGGAVAECRSTTCEFYKIDQRLSPLLGGEGQGEGGF